jgi:uncharacterized protein (TIGR02271 family)
MIEAGRIREGMSVRSADGDRLGKVLKVSGDGFLAEKGFFFPKDYFCQLSDVTDVRDDEIHVRYRKSDLQALARAAEQRGRSAEKQTAAPAAAASSGAQSRASEARIPLAEEEIIPEKRAQQAGEVRVHKEVVTEPRTVEVPVRREEVKVDVVPSRAGAPVGEQAFEEGEVRIPVIEEEVELRKRAVSRGEARISKESREEQVSASGEIRREEIDIEEDGKPRRSSNDESEESYWAGGRSTPKR